MHSRKIMRSVYLMSLGIWMLSMAPPVYGQNTQVTQRVLAVAEITDLEFIASFLEEHFIFPQNQEYVSGVFFDITGDGFGSNDVLVLYPSEEQFQLSAYLPEQMADVLRTQTLETDYRITTTRDLTDVLIEEAENETNPKKALAGAVLGTIRNYYVSGEFHGYISQQNENLRITFWGYDEDMWKFTPRAEQCIDPAETESVMIVTHRQPQIRTFLDIDGCVIVESSTAGGEVSSRVCN